MKRAMPFAALLIPVVLGAQVPQILPGSRLKVTLATGTSIGTLMSQTPDTLIIAESGAIHRRVPSNAVLRVRVSRGRSSGAGAGAGFKRGAIAGASSGMVLGGLATSDGAGESIAEGVLGGAAFFAIFGAFSGTIVGFLVGAEGWKRIY